MTEKFILGLAVGRDAQEHIKAREKIAAKSSARLFFAAPTALVFCRDGGPRPGGDKCCGRVCNLKIENFTFQMERQHMIDGGIVPSIAFGHGPPAAGL
jgi:hypothetical protein